MPRYINSSFPVVGTRALNFRCVDTHEFHLREFNTCNAFTGGWGWLLGVTAFLGVLTLLTAPLMVESPRWLVAKGRDHEAREVMDLRPDSLIIIVFID